MIVTLLYITYCIWTFFCCGILEVADSGHVITLHVKSDTCHHSALCCQVADGRGDLQIRRVAVNVLSKQSHKAYKGQSSSCGFGWGLTAHHKNLLSYKILYRNLDRFFMTKLFKKNSDLWIYNFFYPYKIKYMFKIGKWMECLLQFYFLKVPYYLEVVLVKDIRLSRELSFPLRCASVSSVMGSSIFLS
jgi:hypothetical protein